MSKEKEKLDQDRMDLQWAMSTEQGRRFLWRLISECGIYHDLEGTTDVIHRQAGKRSVGLWLLDVMSDASEDNLFVMMKEAKNQKILQEHLDDNNDTDHHDRRETSDGSIYLPRYEGGNSSIDSIL